MAVSTFKRIRHAAVYGANCAVLAVLLSGCAGADQPANGTASADAASHASHVHQTKSGDLQEQTGNLDTLPGFLKELNPVISGAYRAAADNMDVLAYIPCYCGCGDSAGHRSNLECFIASTAEDGSVVWDDHGTRCGTCMEIALQSAAMKKEGKSIQEIRQTIDAKYKSLAEHATDTPMPPST